MQITADRRALHRIPELDRALPKTLAYLQQQLAPLPCRLFSPIAGSLCAWFDFGADHAIAFRADMDALPVQENSAATYASCHPGAMHACGHDGHMAIALELARRLSRKTQLHHNVLLVFQPAEETTGGAKDICASGIFETYRVRAIFALHLWPGLPQGTLAARREEMMARSCEVNIDISGRSAHIAKASEGADALAAGIAVYTRATAMEQALPEQIFRLLKFGNFHSGTVRNALSDRTRMEGSLRAFQDPVFEGLQQGLRDICDRVAAETGCAVDLHMSDGYPAVLNPGDLLDAVAQIAPFATLPAPSMTAEDFSWYQRTLPGLLFFLGIGDTPALHAADFDFDDTVLVAGADFLEKIAEELP